MFSSALLCALVALSPPPPPTPPHHRIARVRTSHGAGGNSSTEQSRTGGGSREVVQDGGGVSDLFALPCRRRRQVLIDQAEVCLNVARLTSDLIGQRGRCGLVRCRICLCCRFQWHPGFFFVIHCRVPLVFLGLLPPLRLLFLSLLLHPEREGLRTCTWVGFGQTRRPNLGCVSRAFVPWATSHGPSPS